MYFSTDAKNNIWFLICLIALVGFLMLVSGCASMDYQWAKTRPESLKPWLYIEVGDVERTCRELGSDPHRQLARINGCSIWKPIGCEIYLPKNAPEWLVVHERRHCAGEVH